MICDIEIANKLVTPDGDGINDVFQITNIESFPSNSVEIFNRWGTRVFMTEGYDNNARAFSGTSTGSLTVGQSDKLPPGIYFFVIKYLNETTTVSKSGYLYIK